MVEAMKHENGRNKKDEEFSFSVVFLFSKNLFLPTTVTKKSLEMVGSKSNLINIS